MHHSLQHFHPAVAEWFEKNIGTPSPPQVQGWPSIASSSHTLIVAPTGSGKTLAAFLWCINQLLIENLQRPPLAARPSKRKRNPAGIRVVYISPLKALNNDIHRNLELPLKGIQKELLNTGIEVDELTSAVRTGDTTQQQRNAMQKSPPDILITTPESFYLMITSVKTRPLFTNVQYVIIDEIHALSTNKRGVHLSLSLERLEHLVRSAGELQDNSFVRIGLSATQRPLSEVARFLGGNTWTGNALTPRHVSIIDAGYKKHVDIQVVCTERDFSTMSYDSIWSTIFPRLIDEISQHRSTLIFVNNRRLAERVTATLNELLEGTKDTFGSYAVPFGTQRHNTTDKNVPFKVYAYHGSMSRTVREQLEKNLKSGSIAALVTTSALELGIDIGTIDLVIQIQSPKGIARGLQRIGRSGHVVNAQSKGRFYVTHREDLVETAVVAHEMQFHRIEETHIPKNCLDVLAQQLIAMISVEEWNSEEAFDLVRCSYCYSELTTSLFENVLSMLSGRYATDTFRDLRARVVWDKIHNTLIALPGTGKMAILNSGTIPDRGAYGVYLEDKRTKVGEVDEEFIYESRNGDTFILGTNVWRISDIDVHRVTVVPAPGQPARMPFWRGESVGRSFELGELIGSFSTQVASHGIEYLKDYPLDDFARAQIFEYLRDQELATGRVPSNECIVVEGFRDEIGDPRIIVHSCFGKSINGLLGIVLHESLTRRLNIDIQFLYNDDGILFRCSDVERLPLDLFDELTLQHAQQVILDQVASTPLFGALFRQNAERAMLLPKGLPGKRRPFFLQRLRSADLLQIVRQYNDFPIVIETMRECLNDVLDFERFTGVFNRILNGNIAVHTVQTEMPSPFASTMLFDFAAVYMYEWDDPKGTQSSKFSALNHELLGEIISTDPINTAVVKREAVTNVEKQIQNRLEERRARTAEELMEFLLRQGELSVNELQERIQSPHFITALQERSIITTILIGDREFIILSEEAPLYAPIATQLQKDAALTEGEPASTFSRDESIQFVFMRYLRSHGPVTVESLSERYSIPPEECKNILHSLKKEQQIISGQLTENAEGEEWCYIPNFERIRRASMSMLRKEIVPARFSQFTHFLLQWTHRISQSTTSEDDNLLALIEQFQACVIPNELWEREILAPRLKFQDLSLLRQMLSRGEAFLVGTGPGKSQWIIRHHGNYFLRSFAAGQESLSDSAQALLQALQDDGASFLSDLRDRFSYSLQTLNRALSELFWKGYVTNDAFDEIIGIKKYQSTSPEYPEERIVVVNPKRNPFRKKAVQKVRDALRNVPGWNGRWSAVNTRTIMGPTCDDAEKVRAQAEQLLLRYGIVAREIAKREDHLFPWRVLAMEFHRMEMRGEIRRGYFVSGLSGMQFALPDAYRMIEEVKQLPNHENGLLVLNSCDPAFPYGTGIDLQYIDSELMHRITALDMRFTRMPANHCVVRSGQPILWSEQYGSRIYTLVDHTAETVRFGILRLIEHIRASQPDLTEIEMQYLNNERPTAGMYAELLRELGFYRGTMQTVRMELR